MVLGIDEAGRGPVVGPMVVCGVLCKKENSEKLREIGVKDSKVLSPETRESLVKSIKSLIQDFWLIKVPPAKIDKENLNTLEIEAMAEIINKSHAKEVILDAPVRGDGINKYCSRIKELVSHQVKIIGKNHADSIYPVVGAASIIAKVTRDKEIKKLHQKYGDFGSGYPSDPKTKAFIKEWHKYPQIIRRKWKTLEASLITPGKIIVIGDKDTGKTEFCKKLVNLGLKKGYKVGVLDLDIGQSHIGPPGSLGFGIAKKRIRELSKIKPLIIYPVGALSPAGAEERIISGIKTILSKVPKSVDFLVIDTTGYIKDLRFKTQKTELLNPDKIILIERDTELRELIKALDTNKVYRFPVSRDATKKSKAKRKKFRERRSHRLHRNIESNRGELI